MSDFENSRRQFLLEDRRRLGWLSLAELLGSPAWAQQSLIPAEAHAGLPGFPHFQPREAHHPLHMLGAFSVNDTPTTSRSWRRCTARAARIGPRHPSALARGEGTDLIPHRRAGVEVQAVRRNGTMVSDACRTWAASSTTYASSRR